MLCKLVLLRFYRNTARDGNQEKEGTSVSAQQKPTRLFRESGAATTELYE